MPSKSEWTGHTNVPQNLYLESPATALGPGCAARRLLQLAGSQ